MTHDLNLDFQEIRRRYFPKWDAENAWSIKPSEESKGLCDTDNKTILVGKPTKNYTMPVLIIHEIAHDASQCGDHSDKWIAEMKRVTDEARKNGDHQLTDELHAHLEWATGPDAYDVEEETFYDEITRAAMECPGDSFDAIMRHMANRYGQPVNVLLTQYPESRER